ncbi:MAG: tail fiber domain-containing protein [bacterium]
MQFLQAFFTSVALFAASLFGMHPPQPAAVALATNTTQNAFATSSVVTSAQATSTSAQATTTVVNNYITQPVIEKVIQSQKPAPDPTGAINTAVKAAFAASTANLQNQINLLHQGVYGVLTPGTPSLQAQGGFTNNIAVSQRIDQLSGTTISNPTISGGSISGASLSGTSLNIQGNTVFSGDLSVANLSASGALTVSGTTTLQSIAPSTLLYNNASKQIAAAFVGNGLTFSNGTLATSFGTTTANTFTALQQFNANASTTQLSATVAYFGGTATSTFGTDGSLTLASALGVASGGTGWANIHAGSVLFGNGTSALATSSSLFWDNTNSRLGIGTTSPFAALAVNGSGFFNGNLTSTNLIATGTLTVLGSANIASTTLTGNTLLAAATTTSLFASTFGLGAGNYFTSLLGAGLANISGALSLDLAHANIWTGLQQFLGNASTTQLSATTAYFGGTATSTFTSAGWLGIGTSTPSTNLSVQGNGLFSGNLTAASVVATGTLTVGGTSVVSGLGLAIGPGTISLISGGSGYVVGDTMTLTCAGATFTTSPVIAVTAVNSGTITGLTLTNAGVSTIAPGASCTFTQASTSGSGSGASWTGSFAPIASVLSFASLGTGGSANSNGSLFLGAETPAANLSGSEETFVGDRCGGNIVNGSGNTCLGHDAAGIYGGTNLTASGVTFVGQDAGRNYGGGVGQTALGSSALRNVSGNYDTGLGYQAGQNLTTGTNNTIIGYGVAPTLTTGGGNIAIGTGSSTDVALANTSNTLNIGQIIFTTGINTPSTSATNIAGTLFSAGNFSVVNGSIQVAASAAETHVKVTNVSTNGRDWWLTSGGVAGTFSGGGFGLWDNTGGHWSWMADSSGDFNIRGKASIGRSPGTPLNTLDVNGAVAIGSYAGVSTGPSNGLIISGNVGIGTTTPYSRLTVWGPDSAATTSAFAVINNASTTVFSVYDNGNATYSGSIFQSSDQRLKANILSLDASSSLAAVEALNPVSYTRLDQTSQGQNLGFIAQQVASVFPQLVSTTSATALTPDGTLTLNYGGLIAPVIGAIQGIAHIAGDFKENMVAWLGDAANGIQDLFASTIHARNELCVGATCVTPAQFQAMVAAAGQGSGAQGGAGVSNSNSSPDTTPPAISINGANPATIHVGDTYSDLGATVTDNVTQNLGYSVSVDSAATTSPDQVHIDTSAPGSHTILYSAMDQAGNIGYATRSVVVR